MNWPARGGRTEERTLKCRIVGEPGSGVCTSAGDKYSGDTADLPESEARGLIARGIAELVREGNGA